MLRLTPVIAILADVLCWSLLTGVLAYIAYDNSSAVLTAIAAGIGSFAVIKEYREIRHYVRMRRAALRYMEEDENEDY